MTKNLEIKTIEHEGIKVSIAIDYDRGEATLVELDDRKTTYVPKKWLFSNRTLDYMNGWLRILRAQIAAVEEGKRLLEADLAEKSRLKEEAVIKAAMTNKPELTRY